jgi:hypothetical protein
MLLSCTAGCIDYVLGTYDVDTGDALEHLLTILFTFDFFLRFYAYHNWPRFLFSSYMPAIDLLCIVPTYVQWIGGEQGTGRGTGRRPWARVRVAESRR